ncbi:MAG: acylneuraminate cytidylyltransferase family protein [Balneolaceae bacterium]|nr:MAG: acylneuraminate cytidylyltransferase family protein [Balneolaceae bacterium]
MKSKDPVVLAITPARGGSKGVPRKNVKPLLGKPLLQHTVEAARGCPFITRYVVNTEDVEIRQVAESLGVETQTRPEEFWHDNTFQEVDRLLQWSVSDLESKGSTIDIVVLLYATAPLRRSEHITECIDLVLNQGFDSALTLTEDRSYIWKRSPGEHSSETGSGRKVEPVNYDPAKRGPNQKEGWNQWIENKAVYVMKRDLLMDTGCRLGGRIGFTEMSSLDSVDIDRPEDFKLAELLLKLREEHD